MELQEIIGEIKKPSVDIIEYDRKQLLQRLSELESRLDEVDFEKDNFQKTLGFLQKIFDLQQQKFLNNSLSKEFQKLKGEKGDKGEPLRFENLTIEQIKILASETVKFVRKAKDGKDGEKGDDGYTPTKGKDYFTSKEIEDFSQDILEKIGIEKRVEKEFAKIAKSLEISQKESKEVFEKFKTQVTKNLLAKIEKLANIEIDPKEIVAKLESLKGDNRLSAEAIKDLPIQLIAMGGGSGSGGGGGTWGSITGTLSDQTDLQNALDLKADISSLATVATTGQYLDLTGTPTLATVATSGDYTDLINTPTIPTVPGQKNSIELDTGDLQLVGDTASPGNNKVYGTDGSGVKGWKDDPSGGGGGASLWNPMDISTYQYPYLPLPQISQLVELKLTRNTTPDVVNQGSIFSVTTAISTPSPSTSHHYHRVLRATTVGGLANIAAGSDLESSQPSSTKMAMTAFNNNPAMEDNSSMGFWFGDPFSSSDFLDATIASYNRNTIGIIHDARISSNYIIRVCRGLSGTGYEVDTGIPYNISGGDGYFMTIAYSDGKFIFSISDMDLKTIQTYEHTGLVPVSAVMRFYIGHKVYNATVCDMQVSLLQHYTMPNF